MGDARARPGGSDDERLPWLTTPRRASVFDVPPLPKASAAPRRRRSSRTPLLALLALFMLAGIGVIFFLAGRGSVAPEQAAAARRATLDLAPAVERAAPAAEPAPVAAADAPNTPVAALPAPAARPKAAAPRKVRRPRISDATVADVGKRRADPEPSPEPRPIAPVAWQPTAPPAAPGRVIELGIYAHPAQAEAAWRRLVGVYPYLAKRPRVVALDRPVPGQPVRYRLQAGARTRSDARALCRNLINIGRGCTVLAAPAK